MKRLIIPRSKLLHLSLWQGVSEERSEVYLNTLNEYRSLQRRQRPRTPAEFLAQLEGRLVWCRSLGWM